MQIVHGDVEEFAEGRVNLPPSDAKRHREQVNGLRKRLEAKIAADPNYGLVKMLHAGSVAKGTALRTVNDLDVAVYVKASAAPGRDPDLVPWLADRLAEANPSMGRDQFEENDHCVNVNFKGSGLNVDVVPVLYEGERNDLGALLEAELEDRADRRRHRRITEARFPRLKRLEDFEFAEAPQIPAATIADLASCGSDTLSPIVKLLTM